MTDPVCDKDGHAYERTAVLQRLANGAPVSPISKAPLTATDLTTDHALKYSCDQPNNEIPYTRVVSERIFSLA
eukprot:COSAG02_NODE_6072_length_3822_cov_19.557511_2_plen_73_part_00